MDKSEGSWKSNLMNRWYKDTSFWFKQRKKNSEFQHKNLIITVKHGGGSIMVSFCSTAAGLGQFAIIKGTINVEFSTKI